MNINNSLFQRAGRKLGVFFFRILPGQTHSVNRATRRTCFSEKQTAAQSKFQAATQYAKRQMAREASQAMYCQGITDRKRSAYVVAVSDFMNAPIVHHIHTEKYRGKIDDTITVRATDDFMVMAVKVAIKGSDGKTLEEGEALPDPFKEHIWKYRTRVTNLAVAGTTITAVAYDLPGNTGYAEEVIR